MSLLNLKNLKTKTEPKYTKKIFKPFEDDLPGDETSQKISTII